ncbi:hypothetical protein MMPV_005046 [Pyropia vietnamensis]
MGMGLGLCVWVAALVPETTAAPVVAGRAVKTTIRTTAQAAVAVLEASSFAGLNGDHSGSDGSHVVRASSGGDGDGDHGGGGHHPPPNPRVAEILGVCLVVFQALLHAALHALEGWLTASHPGLLPALRVLYRELLILGVVSLMLVIVVTFGSLPARAVASFEFAHLLIFALAVFYTATLLGCSWASSVLSRRWQRLEALSLDTYLAYKEEYNALRSQRSRHANVLWRRVGAWASFNPVTLARFAALHEAMTFHDVRFQYIFYRDLPTHFAFGAFLNRVKGSLFTSLVEVPASSWAVLLPIILADMARREWAPGEGGMSRVDRYMLLGLSAVTVIVVEWCRWKVGRVYWQLFRHPATYFNTNARPTVGECSRVGGGADSIDGNGSEGGLDPPPRLAGDVSASRPPAWPKLNVALAMTNGSRAVSLEMERVPLTPRTADDAPSQPVYDGGSCDGGGGGGGDFVDSLFTGNSRGRRTSVGDVAVASGGRHSTAGRRLSLDRFLHRGGRDSDSDPSDGNTADVESNPHDSGASDGGGGGVGGLGVRRHSIDVRLEYPAGGRRSSVVARNSGHRRASIEAAGNLPLDELRRRHLLTEEASAAATTRTESGGGTSFNGAATNSGQPTGTRSGYRGRLRRSRRRVSFAKRDGGDNGGGGGALKKVNSAVVQRYATAAAASAAAPTRAYPRWLVRVVPRLGRVASPSERLFWFGSHAWFLWLLQTNLFGVTLLAALTVAVYSTSAYTDSLASLTVEDLVIMPVVAVSFGYVLARTAAAMRLYAFVINSTGLLEEQLALSVIDRVLVAEALHFRYAWDGGRTAWEGAHSPPSPASPAAVAWAARYAPSSSPAATAAAAAAAAAAMAAADPAALVAAASHRSGASSGGGLVTAVSNRSAPAGAAIDPEAAAAAAAEAAAAAAADRQRCADLWTHISANARHLLVDAPPERTITTATGEGGGSSTPGAAAAAATSAESAPPPPPSVAQRLRRRQTATRRQWAEARRTKMARRGGGEDVF